MFPPDIVGDGCSRLTAASVSIVSQAVLLFQVLPKELRQLVEGDNVHPVVKVRVNSIRDEQQLLVVPRQLGKSVLAEIAGVGLLAVHNQDGAADLVGIGQDGLIHKGHTADDVPATVGVEGPGMIAARGLVVVEVVLKVEGGVLRHGIRYTAAQGVLAVLVVGQPLSVQSLALGITGLLAVLGVKVAVGVYPAHVVHGGGHSCLDPGIQSSHVQRQSAPAADADNTDLRPVHILP